MDNTTPEPIDPAATQSLERQFVLLTVGPESYGIDIGAIHAIIMPQPVTEVPKTAPYVKGVTNLRGTILPIVDMRIRFGLEPLRPECAKHSRIVVVETAAATAGLIVDAVTEVASLKPDDIEPPSKLVASEAAAFISGVGKATTVDGGGDRLVMILDVDRLLETSGAKAAQRPA